MLHTWDCGLNEWSAWDSWRKLLGIGADTETVGRSDISQGPWCLCASTSSDPKTQGDGLSPWIVLNVYFKVKMVSEDLNSTEWTLRALQSFSFGREWGSHLRQLPHPASV